MTKAQNKRIRKGDKVYICSGNDRGQNGEVLSRTENHVIVQGINMRKKHVKRTQDNPQGGIIEIERPMHISNVRLCPDEERPVRVKVRKDEQGNRELYYQLDEKASTYRSIKKS